MSIKNGHAPAKIPSQSASARRMRLFRERRKRGAVVLQAEIQPDMISALVQLGWLNGIEVRNRQAVVAAIGAIVNQATAAEMRPALAGKLFVPVDMQALESALIWLKPGEPVNVQSAGKAVGIVAKCARQVGFLPAEYVRRAREMLDATQ